VTFGLTNHQSEGQREKLVLVTNMALDSHSSQSVARTLENVMMSRKRENWSKAKKAKHWLRNVISAWTSEKRYTARSGTSQCNRVSASS
jgi:hypothetical protein